ncbi:MAG: hypothetical protein IRZ11_04245 [Clostridia bacterium]|nr:hypothetical protein [Clostridia bacterium]
MREPRPGAFRRLRPDPGWLRGMLRYAYLVMGLVELGYGLGILVRANAGLDPWSVLTMGFTHVLPVTFGRSSQILGIFIIAIAWLLGRRPTLATLVNMYVVGAAYDAFDRWGWLPPPAATPAQSALLLALGVLATTFAGTWYMHANLGAGPRDSLFLALVERTGYRISVVQWGLQGLVTVVGYLLGGPVGVGTAVAVAAAGPCQELWFRAFRWASAQPWTFGLVEDPVRRRAVAGRGGSA